MEIRYWRPGIGPFEQSHVIKLPYGEIAVALCGLRTAASKGVFTEEPFDSTRICVKCLRRLKAQRKRERAQEVEDLRKLRRWDPSHTYLGGDQ